MKSLTKEQLIQSIKRSKSRTKREVYCEVLGSPSPNSRTLAKFKLLAEDLLGNSFDNYVRDAWFTTTKVCPVCGGEFTRPTHVDSVTCSHSCANKHFAGIIRHKNPKGYRTICFRKHKKECVVCSECRIVEVHHLDENHLNNGVNNLIPLCPTCHKLWHSRFIDDVRPQVLKYVESL